MSPVESWNLALLAHFAAPSQPIPWLDQTAILFAKGGPFLLAAGLVGAWLWSRGKKTDLLEAIEAGLVGLGINQIIAGFTFYPRPYMLGLVRPLMTHAYETSFPSDHATLLFGVGAYLAWSRRPWTGGLVLVLGLLTSWGRVYGGVHFPLDIVGSAAVALCATVVARLARTALAPAHRWVIDLYTRVFAGPIRRGWVRGSATDTE